MKLNERVQELYQTLQEQAFRSRILLLHPQSKYRSVLVAMLVNDDSNHTYYYALGPDDVNLGAFIQNITRDLGTQHAKFGQHINMLPHDVYENYEANLDQLVEAFASELAAVSDKPYVLVLDEYDRSDTADQIHRFIERLADHLPETCSIILNTRTMPRLPWVSMVAKKQATLLLDDQLIEEDFYGSRKDSEYDLEVFALGPGYVLHRGNKIESWEGHLPRLLFFFSLDKPVVTRSEICNAFWPNLALDQAVNVFHVTKRRLHKALGIDVLEHTDNHYGISSNLHVYYDALDFAETLMRGRNPNTENPFEQWQHVVKLYRGPFLQGHNDGWIDERRTAFRAGYLEAMTEMAQAWIGKDRKELALKLYREALDEDYRQEQLHQQIMQLYSDLGRRSEAVAHFQEMEKSFTDAGLSISDATSDVYKQISE